MSRDADEDDEIDKDDAGKQKLDNIIFINPIIFICVQHFHNDLTSYKNGTNFLRKCAAKTVIY